MRLPIDRKKGGWLLPILLAVFCMTTGTALAGDYYVKIDGLDGPTCGASWTAACETVGAALSQASGSDTVHVGAGTYAVNIKITGGVSLLGGYVSGGGTSDRDPVANPTILQGKKPNSPVIHANFASGKIDGFTISNGHGNKLYGGGIAAVDCTTLQISNNLISDNTAQLGGGIYGNNYNGGKIESNIILNNSSSWHGGGIHLASSVVDMLNNTVKNNTSQAAGGGAYLSGILSGSFEGNTIEGNFARSGGGGLYVVGSDIAITKCNITLNSTPAAGGGLNLNDYVGVVSYCMITDNSAVNERQGNGSGGGVFAGSSNGNILFIYDTIAGNIADSAPGILSYTNSLVIQYSIVWHNGYDFYGQGGLLSNYITDESGIVLDIELVPVPLQVDISYSDVSDPLYINPDNSVMNHDPGFVGDGDYHLSEESLCIGAFTTADGKLVNIGADQEATAGGDNNPPVCTAANASPDILWPPNHKMADINISGVTDPDEDDITITVGGITHNEISIDGEDKGTGKTSPDSAGEGTDTAQVRAERSGKGNGRTYTISFTASDGQGGECNGSVQVIVPHDQGN